MQKKQFVLSFIVALILISSIATVSAATRTITIKVQGMTCGGCATRVEEALKSTEGVQEVQVSFEHGRAVIKYDDQKVTPEKLREVIQNTGFSCDVKQ